MIIMKTMIYKAFVIGLMASVPSFQEFAMNCCPTYWLNGKKCEPVYHIENIACMELERLEYLHNF